MAKANGIQLDIENAKVDVLMRIAVALEKLVELKAKELGRG